MVGEDLRRATFPKGEGYGFPLGGKQTDEGKRRKRVRGDKTGKIFFATPLTNWEKCIIVALY